MQAANECIPFQGPPPDDRQKILELLSYLILSHQSCNVQGVAPATDTSQHHARDYIPLLAEHRAFGSEVRSQRPAADYANLPFRYAMFLLFMKAERKRCVMF